MNDPRVNFLYVDMNSYFASVEQQEEPALRGRPVGIVTIARGNAACIAASYEAKRLGVGMGVRMREARELCPDIVFRPARHDVYVRYHHLIKAAVERVYPVEGVHSVDEFSCRLTGREAELNVALALAEQVRTSIYEYAGVALRCSIGLGTSRLLAKVAGELHKPAGLDWLTADVLPQKIAHLEIEDIAGVGRNMGRRLRAAGVDTVAALFALPPKHARKIWNSVSGERFILALKGENVAEVKTSSHSLGHGQVLAPVNTTPDNARLVARRLLIKAGTRLRRGEQFAGSLSISAKCAEWGWQNCYRRMPATQDSFILLAHFTQMWRELKLIKPLNVSVTLGGLRKGEELSGDLFVARETINATTSREKLCALVDALNQRHGQDTVIYGERPKELAPYTGAKIAFGRIPTFEEFLD